MTAMLLLLAALNAHAGQAPDFTVTTAAVGDKLSVSALPPDGHHINVKAPMELVDSAGGARVKPSSAKARKVVFQVPGAGSRDLIVRLFLCDDANTFCERHQVTVKADGTNVAAAHDDAAAGQSGPATPTGGKIKRELGFILNNPKAALDEAARRHSPLIIDFFGIWCPPCNMLDETVFPSREFRKASANFVKLKLDADSPVSWELKSKFHVTGYPTVIFASADGEELSRIVGFRPRDQFNLEVARAWQGREQSFSQLKAKADSGDAAAAMRVGRVSLERGDFAVAKTYLEKAKGQPEQAEALVDAQIGLAETESPAKLAEALEQGLAGRSDSVDAIDWRSKLADAYEALGQSDKMRAMLGELVKAVDELLTHPEKLAGHDALPGDLLEIASDAQEKLGPEDKARASWLRAANAYRDELKHAGRDAASERGYNLELAYCLGKSGDGASAEKIYSRLEKKYPREFTFYFGHARMEHELKRDAAARELARKAYEFSYGDNRLRAAELLAKVYSGVGDKTNALNVVRETLASADVPDDKLIRTHRYVKKLKDLEKSLLEQGASK